MAKVADTPKVKRARYVAGQGDRAQTDRLRQKYEDELSTPGLTERHRKDLERALAALEEELWGDKPALRAVPKQHHDQERQQQPRPPLRRRVSSATAIHARRGGSAANRGIGLGSRRVRSSAGRRFGQTGIPAASESIAELTMRTVGIIAGLSFVYLLLTPRGTRAIQLASSGGVHALRALVSPQVDPLRAASAGPRALAGLPPKNVGANVASSGQAVANAANQAINSINRAVGAGALKPKPAAAPSVAGAFTG